MSDRTPPPDSEERDETGSLQFRSAADAAGFTILPNPVLLSARVTPLAKVVYALLRHFAWQTERAWPGRQKLMALVPCSPPTLTKSMQELQTLGLIGVQRRGQGKTNLYWLEPLDDTTLEALK